MSLGTRETIMSKVHFEQWLWEQAAADIRHLHSDDSILTAESFGDNCNQKGQFRVFWQLVLSIRTPKPKKQ